MPNPYNPPTMRGDVEPWGHCRSGDSILSCDPLEVEFNMDSLSRDRRGDAFRIRGSCRELVATGACIILGETGLLEELKVLKVLQILVMPAAEEALSDILTRVRTSRRSHATDSEECAWAMSKHKYRRRNTHEISECLQWSRLIHLKHVKHTHLIIVPHIVPRPPVLPILMSHLDF